MAWWSRKNRKLKADELALVAEATAFLTGHVTRTTIHEDGELPAWARINFVAHARPQLLLRELDSEQCSAAGWCGDPWIRVRHELLRELVGLAGGRTRRIERLQRECLIPLELQLIGPSNWSAVPGEILTMGLASLRAHPTAVRQHSSTPPEG